MTRFPLRDVPWGSRLVVLRWISPDQDPAAPAQEAPSLFPSAGPVSLHTMDAAETASRARGGGAPPRAHEAQFARASACALSCWYSASVMLPASSKSFARAISSVGVEPATC